MDFGANIGVGTFSIIFYHHGGSWVLLKLLNLWNTMWSSLLSPYWKMSFKIDKIKLHKVAVGKASVKKVCLQVFASTKQNPNLGSNQITNEATDLGINCVPLVRLDTIVSRCPDLVVKVDV